MNDWTQAEKKWLEDVRALLKVKPKKIKLYTTEANVLACKLGVSSYELNETLANEVINCGACITDLHDELCNNG